MQMIVSILFFQETYKNIRIYIYKMSQSTKTSIGNENKKVVVRSSSMSPEEFQRDWVRPDLPSKCTWHLGVNSAESPHNHVKHPV